MISEDEFKNQEEVFYYNEIISIRNEITVEQFYEITEQESLEDVLHINEIQNDNQTQEVLEFYKTLFWGLFALISLLLSLYFFINRFLVGESLRFFNF